jgi:hypothetical protein
MSYIVGQLKTDLTGILHGTNLNKIQGLEQLIDRAAREILLDVDPIETQRTQALSLVYDDVFEVALPSDLKGNKIIDIEPQRLVRNFDEDVRQQYIREFDLFKQRQFNKTTFNIQYNTGVKTLRVDTQTAPQGTTLNDLGTVTSNGTWTTFGSAVNLEQDTIIFYQGSSSLRFDLDGTSLNGGIEITMDTAVDLSSKEAISTLFEWLYFPNASGVTSVELRWGSSSTDYFSTTVVTDFSGNALQNSWNQLGFDWNAATTQVGTPDASATTYIQVSVNYDGVAQSGVRADQITVTEGFPFDIVYYSAFLFSDNGVFVETVTDDNTAINLATESYNLLTYKCAQLCFQQQHDFGDTGGFESDKWGLRYAQALDRYRSLYKSELVKPRGNYYRPDLNGNRNIGRRNFR